jgi:hypothetical protein
MAFFRRTRLGLLVVMAIVSTVGAICLWPAPRAQAFYIQNHELIVRNALPADQVDQAAIGQILIGPPLGAGAVGSDAFFNDEFRHIDNAKNPADVCALTQEAWTFFTPDILSGAQPTGPGGTDLVDGPAARAAFGGLAHALEDFYAHTSWVELSVDAGDPQRLAPPLMPTCDPATLPAGLHSGYFNLDFGNHEDPLSGCPPAGPPPGFVECHTTLNKDGPNTLRGGVWIPGLNMNYYDLASLDATRATTNLFSQVRELVVSNAGECAARNLFQADRHEACW